MNNLNPFQPKNFAFLILIWLTMPLTISAQVGFLRIVLTGRELPQTIQAEQRGQLTFLPLAPLARELGYTVNIDSAAQTVRIRRVAVEAEFIKQTAEVRENGVTVTVVPFAAEVVFPPNPDALLLPVEAAAPLLNVSIIIDKNKNIVRIESRDVSSTTVSRSRGNFEVAGLNYVYNSSFSNGSFFQNLNLISNGRIGSSIYQANVNFLGGSNRNFINFYSGNFTLRRRQKDEFQFGDLTTAVGSELSLLNTLVRGVSYSRAAFDERAKLSFYGGRSFSGATQNLFRQSSTLPFDTTLFGGRFTFRPEKLKQNTVSVRNLVFSAGSIFYSGARNKGIIFDGTARYTTSRFNLEAELAAGNFNSQTLDNREIKGFGTALLFRGSYTPWRFLTLQGRYDRFSPNFSSPQRSSQNSNRETKSFGFTVQPLRNLSFGATASISESKNPIRVGDVIFDKFRTESYSLSLGYDPEIKFLPRFSISSTTIKNSLFGSFTFTNANFSRDFKNFRPYLNYILTTGSDNTAHGLNFGVGIIAGKFGHFQVQQSLSLTKSNFLRDDLQCRLQVTSCPTIFDSKAQFSNHSGNVDWTPQGTLFKYLLFSVGGGYIKDTERTSFQFRTSVGFYLPFRQLLQVSYNRSIFNNELRITIAGPLAFWKPKQLLNEQITEEAVLTESTIQGRVYLDENGNRQYDPNIDVSIGGVRVRLDNGNEIISNENGIYTFDRVSPGEHHISLNLEDVRANLVPANGLEQTITVLPRTIVNVDFRLVKSGTLSGRIWHDANGNGKFDDGESLPDIHVVSSSGRDTYTDPDGSFLLSELPPGEQTIFIDERYHPEDLTTANMSLRAEVKSGVETKNIAFVFKTKPREVKEINFGAKIPTNPTTTNPKDKDK